MSTRHARIADKELNEKHTKILIELLQRPENKQCADCKKKDPRWASWNLGVFVCIRCSGTHRSLGTHISKVKSVDLDTWIPEQVESMQNWGNQKANIYWEADLNGRLPTENNMDMWIRAKYEQRKWARKGPVPDPRELAIDLEIRKNTNVMSSSPKVSSREHTLHGAEMTKRPSSVRSNNSDSSLNITLPVSNGSHRRTSSSSTPKLSIHSLQAQLSGLSTGQSSGLIPKAPPGSNMSWTNFLTAPRPADTNSTLSQPSIEKPLIPYDAFASLLKN